MKTLLVVLGSSLVAVLPPGVVVQGTGSTVQPCLAAAADASPVYPTSVFPSAVGEIDVAFRMGDGEHHDRLVATWIAVDVGHAMPPNDTIGSTEQRLTPGTTAGVFRYELEWFPPGAYRVDIRADGAASRSVNPEVVRGVAVSMKHFFQNTGRVHAMVTATIASTDARGTHVSWARGGVPFSDEWWLVGHGGFAAVKRSAEDESLVLDPPQVFFPWPVPVMMGAQWNYVSRDETVRQSYRIWGPVPIKGPAGEAPGYVVLVEQRTPMATATVEREYLPGVGMVRSLAIAGFGAERVNR
jgi:hypothetical protein